MKTFKLIRLKVIEEGQETIEEQEIDLIDGLIINREDEQNRWLLEAYVNKTYESLFTSYKDTDAKLVLQTKITKQSNNPAMFMATVIDVNEIGEDMNVLFMGTMVDYKKEQVEQMLKKLIDEGYQGEELFEMFRIRTSEQPT
ncbi:hypothetical protein N781_03720 [Pontibacillus halophilus JSM 076056 = DSM 19796]|uniref:YwpF-like protein n=1 Tax=Pontibacillus halophilus JSM 076056 = DSM 19796 TaxID=1385510 RepID=A0A0A5GEG3_9BACI|nr:YwpF family protein [Pontibacillus halophilus]KGX91606.1 hypothetical protein N781_03720 [Pontibacillus halophilus JSM 076056 = DSM 19796]